MSAVILSLYCTLREFVYFLTFKILGYNYIIRPFMRFKEIIIIEEILKNKKPEMCLEYGSGYSTLYFTRNLEEKAKWISIEHNKSWFEKIKQVIRQNSNIIIYYKPPNQGPPWADSYNDGAFLDFKDYIQFPQSLNENFDFILIDGRARKFCLEAALKILKKGGVVILHDANRKYYRKPFRLYKYQLLFEDSRRSAGGMFIGSKNLDPSEILDINKHKLNWRILKYISKLEEVITSLLRRRKAKMKV